MTVFLIWVTVTAVALTLLVSATAVLIPTTRTCTAVQAADPEHTPTIYKEQ